MIYRIEKFNNKNINFKKQKTMWLKIILAIVGIIVIGFIGMVIKMAITDAKEETRDIEEASKKKAKE